MIVITKDFYNLALTRLKQAAPRLVGVDLGMAVDVLGGRRG